MGSICSKHANPRHGAAMLLGPVFTFELVTTSRRLRFLLLRTLFASLLLLVLVINYTGVRNQMNAGTDKIRAAALFAQNVFAGFGWLTLTTVVLVGPIIASGTLAIERERRTIEYLFTSQLTNAEIVLGKLFVRLLQLGCILMAGLPILSLSMLMGGISPTLVAGLAVMTVSTGIFVTSLALWQSAWSSTVRAAVNKSLRVIGMFFLIGPMLGMLVLLAVIPGGVVPTWVRWALTWVISPISGFLNLFNPFTLFFQRDALLGLGSFWQHVGTLVLAQGLVSVACMVLAIMTIRRAHTGKTGKAETISTAMWWRRAAVWDRHPMMWKEMLVDRVSGSRAWVNKLAEALVVLGIVATSIGFYVWALWYTLSPEDQRGYMIFPAMVIGVCAGGAGAVFAASRAASSVTVERERDCWVSILGSPMSGHEIVLAKWCGAIYSLRWLWAGILFAWLLPCTWEWGLIFAVAPAAVAVLTTTAFGAALGILLSLICMSSLRAMGATIFIQLFVGGGYMFLIAPLVVLSGNEPSEFIWAGVVPFLSAFPFICYFEAIVYGRGSINSEEIHLGVACLLGYTGYLFGTIGLLAAAIAQFSRLTGRREGHDDVYSDLIPAHLDRAQRESNAASPTTVPS